jgi:hypothetical protein
MSRIIYILLGLSLLFITESVGQKDSLRIEFTNFGADYYHNGSETDKSAFKTYLAQVDPALKKYKVGQRLNFGGKVLTYIGGALIAVNIYDVFFEKKDKYTFGIAGAGLIGAGIPISNWGKRKTKAGIEIYNTSDRIPSIKIEEKLEKKPVFTSETALLVRVPVFGKKINYLTQALTKPNLNPKARASFEKQLKTTITENKAYFDIITEGFKTNYTSSEVFFVPDSLFKQFNAGRRDVFLNENNEIDPSIKGPKDDYLLMIQGNSVEQLLLVDKNGNQLDKPFPYKRNTFLPAFKKLFEREKYMSKQIAWFDKKLTEIKYLQK